MSVVLVCSTPPWSVTAGIALCASCCLIFAVCQDLSCLIPFLKKMLSSPEWQKFHSLWQQCVVFKSPLHLVWYQTGGVHEMKELHKRILFISFSFWRCISTALVLSKMSIFWSFQFIFSFCFTVNWISHVLKIQNFCNYSPVLSEMLMWCQSVMCPFSDKPLPKVIPENWCYFSPKNHQCSHLHSLWGNLEIISYFFSLWPLDHRIIDTFDSIETWEL